MPADVIHYRLRDRTTGAIGREAPVGKHKPLRASDGRGRRSGGIDMTARPALCDDSAAIDWMQRALGAGDAYDGPALRWRASGLAPPVRRFRRSYPPLRPGA